jgi:DNA polymerase (family 10)
VVPEGRPRPTNAQLADLFQTAAEYLALDGASVYRIAAYERAAETFREHPAAIAELAAQHRLRELQGVGETLEAKVIEVIETGSLSLLEEYRRKYPETLLEITRLPGVGPKTARRIYETLGAGDTKALRVALDTGDILRVPGMGEKSRANLSRALDSASTRHDRRLLGDVAPQAHSLAEALRGYPMVVRADVAGSVRRRRSTVRDIDLVVASDGAEAVIDRFSTHPLVASIEERGPTKLVTHLQSGLNADLRVVPPGAYGDLLQHSTGSAAHNIALRALAQKLGLKISEYHVQETATSIAHVCATEEDVYALLGLPWIPPELREDRGEIEAALEGRLPCLIERNDLRGDLHVHTDWSDGHATLEEMALGARERGLEYLCFSDHSQSLGMGKGLSPDEVRAQAEDIRTLDGRLQGIRLLTGSEVDILADGRLDLPDDVLAELDVVTASIHSGFSQPEERIMRRLESALENPHVDVIGHPTGRLLTRRPSYAVDVERLIEGAARTGTALEINAAFHRLDLSGTHARRAREQGVMLTISSDAHDVRWFDLLDFGIGEARRGWLEARDVLNTRPYAWVEEWTRRDAR